MASHLLCGNVTPSSWLLCGSTHKIHQNAPQSHVMCLCHFWITPESDIWLQSSQNIHLIRQRLSPSSPTVIFQWAKSFCLAVLSPLHAGLAFTLGEILVPLLHANQADCREPGPVRPPCRKVPWGALPLCVRRRKCDCARQLLPAAGLQSALWVPGLMWVESL